MAAFSLCPGCQSNSLLRCAPSYPRLPESFTCLFLGNSSEASQANEKKCASQGLTPHHSRLFGQAPRRQTGRKEPQAVFQALYALAGSQFTVQVLDLKLLTAGPVQLGLVLLSTFSHVNSDCSRFGSCYSRDLKILKDGPDLEKSAYV